MTICTARLLLFEDLQLRICVSIYCMVVIRKHQYMEMQYASVHTEAKKVCKLLYNTCLLELYAATNLKIRVFTKYLYKYLFWDFSFGGES